MLTLGTTVPPFHLPDLAGQWRSADEFAAAPGLLVAFICSHCPFVQHIRRAFGRVTADLQQRGLAVVAINSNDEVAFPEDGVDGMRREAEAGGYNVPSLRDEAQQVAKAYCAACTPDLILFDRDRRLVYRGQFDGSRPRSGTPVTGEDLRAAADAVLSGLVVPTEQRPSVGCNIKWKRGNEPEYFR
jgi:peroxiredoxin